MADTSTVDYAGMNCYQKLIIARKKFLDLKVSKSGKNTGIGFMYYELSDIVPAVTDIFNEVGLIALISYSEDTATMTVVNVNVPTDSLIFSSPMKQLEANRGTNPLQALGASHTYLRRYLYMAVMDICEPDSIEPTLEIEPTVTATVTPKAPATIKPVSSAERTEIKKELTTQGTENITPEQIQALKDACRNLVTTDPEQGDYVKNLLASTQNFATLNKSQANALITNINEAIKAAYSKEASPNGMAQ